MIVKTKTITLIFLFIFTLGTISVLGGLQTTERVHTSGIVVLSVSPPAPITPTPGGSGGTSPPPSEPEPTPEPSPVPEPNIEIGIFSDVGCTTPMTSIEWGSLEPGGSSINHIYILNSGDVNVQMFLDTNNWYPQGSENFMTLSWDYDGSYITPGEVRHVILTLSIDVDCPAYTDFWVDIIIYHS